MFLVWMWHKHFMNTWRSIHASTITCFFCGNTLGEKIDIKNTLQKSAVWLLLFSQLQNVEHLFCFVFKMLHKRPQKLSNFHFTFTSQMSREIFMKHFHFERSNPLSLLTCIRKCNLAFEYIWRILIRGSSISLWYLTHLIKTETPLKVNGLGDFDNISAYFHELTWESQKP